MSSGNIRLFCGVRCAALLFAIWLVAPAGRALGQQPIRPADTEIASRAASAPANEREAEAASIDEMRATISALERRVKELETRLAKDEPAAPAGAAPAGADAAAAAQPAAADASSAKPADPAEFPAFFRNTEITGFVDLYYGYNFNSNSPHTDAQLRNFDTKHNQFGLNLVEIAFEKKPTEADRVGFRTDLDFGPATEIVHSAEPGGEGVFRHLEQAYVSYLAPVGKGLQVDAGKFVTPHGAEVIETKDNWNYSRSLLFALAIPYYHFGVRASYPISDKASVAGYVVNGWNDVVDNNRSKTYGAQLILKPTSKLSIVQNYMGGPEQADNDDDWRHLVDTTVTYAVTPAVTLMANYDYGKDRVDGAGVHWQGVATYARVQLGSQFAFSPRFEWYDDHDGFTTGLAQTLKEFTITGEHGLGNGMIARFEYRRDFSDEPFFSKSDDRLVKAQSTVTFGIVYSFSSFGGK